MLPPIRESHHNAHSNPIKRRGTPRSTMVGATSHLETSDSHTLPSVFPLEHNPSPTPLSIATQTKWQLPPPRQTGTLNDVSELGKHAVIKMSKFSGFYNPLYAYTPDSMARSQSHVISKLDNTTETKFNKRRCSLMHFLEEAQRYRTANFTTFQRQSCFKYKYNSAEK